MSLAIPTLARRPRPHRRRTLVSQPSPHGGVRRIILRFEWLEDRTVLSTFTVTNLDDAGPGSLRQAILDSSADTGGPNTIDFQIPGQGVQVIAPASPLPAITGAVLVDGWSQPGFASTPLIELDGSQAGTADGLTITGPDVTVRGLDIGGFGQGAGIHITGSGATGDWIYGDFLGTDPTGTQAAPNTVGVEIDVGAAHNLVGTNGDGVNDAGERNLLSGNQSEGVWIHGQGTSGNAVAGNFIGTDVKGTAAVDTGVQDLFDSQGDFFAGGVAITGGASGNRIGTDGESADDIGERNVISGNIVDGVDIIGSQTSNNIVAGNFIGTDASGERPLGNGEDGVYPADGASFNRVGVDPTSGMARDEGNVISGNGNAGVHIFDGADNVVSGNEIGADSTGTLPLPNVRYGVDIENTSNDNTIGGTTAPAGNLITDNDGPGVVVGTSAAGTPVGDEIIGNRIYGNTGQAIDLGDDGSTANSTAPGQGPNDVQNFPILSRAADGGFRGELSGSLPDTSFHIEFFASPAYRSDGSGEAEDFLGAIEVRTDATGRAAFTIPFTVPTGLPIITATATDPRGNTSEVSAPRTATLAPPPPSLRAVANRTLIFSAASGNGLTIQDPAVGPNDPVWSLTLSVSTGTFSLLSTAGLTGSGDGTGSLSYSGPLSAVDAALDGLAYTPPPGPEIYATLSLGARSFEVAPLADQLLITNGVFVVTTTADGGPGSLRQAISKADTVTAGAVAIDFAIPAAGAQTIGLSSPLPAITTSMLVDGTTQPGYAGTPLIAFASAAAGSPLVVAAGDVILRGLALQSVAINPVTTEQLIASVEGQGAMGQLSLLESRGAVIIQSQGAAPDGANGWISENLAAGAYSLTLTGVEGTGPATWTIMLRPTAAPFGVIGVGSYPDAMVAGDFNGDGHLDLATSSFFDHTISVLLDNGDGTFQSQVTYAVGESPGPMVAGDFNGDGHLDLAVADRDGIQLLLGDGDGTFQPTRTVAPGILGPMVAGDFNGDGRLDLAVADDNVADYNDGTVSVLLGDGDGTFRPPSTYAVGAGPVAIVTGDFAGDGHLDLATSSFFDNTISVLLGNGDGTFQHQVTYVAAKDPSSIAVGDFTGDGHLDLAVANVSAVISVLLGNGDGTFQTPVTSYEGGSAGVNPGIIVAGNFNGDHRLDLAAADSGSNAVSVLLGDGDGTFQPQVASAGGTTSPVGLYPDAMVAGDFNGDGRLDLAVANDSSDTVSVLLGDGDGTFQPQLTYPVGNGPNAMVAGDFNGDGRLDLAVTNPGGGITPGTVSVLLGNGDGTFQPQVTYEVGRGPESIAVGDFTGDGHLDLAVANSIDDTVSMLLGNGDGTFRPQVTYAVGREPQEIVAGDFTGDGHLDLALLDTKGVELLLGDGDGTFQTAKTIAAETFGPLVAGDFNGDGHLDLAVANQDNTILVLLSNGDGAFRPPVPYPVGAGPAAIVMGDFSGDGHLDLVTANVFDNTISVLLGIGDGTFQPPVTYTAGVGAIAMATGDFTGDGRTDLALTSGSSAISVLLGNGGGAFSAPGQTVINPLASPVVADVNGDGINDVLVVDGAGHILYRQGIPGQPGTFEPPITINPGYPSRDIVWVPDTGDGPLLASVDARDNAVSLYDWRDGAFAGVGSLATGALPAQIVAADLDSTGLDDLVVRNAGDGTLSVFFSAAAESPATAAAPFLPAVIVPVGLGTSDVQAVATSADGRLDLVATNKLSGQVDVLINWGRHFFVPTVPYRAGSGLSAVDPAGTPEVTSLEATAGIAAGPLTLGGPNGLVTINPGTYTLSVLAGLGAARFANPATIPTPHPFQVVRMADLNGDGIADLAVLSADGVSFYLGDGHGGFDPPVTYDAGPDPDGLTIADVNHDGHPDLLVGDAYGDILVLQGDGDGTFSPYHEANQAVALAVADLTGSGQPDFIYADQGLDRVTVQYGGQPGSVLADRSDGLLSPGAVQLADMNGDGIPDLIVANSGSNNILIYPGLSNGQFGPALNDGHGFDAGTDPVGFDVVDLTGDGRADDLVVADAGSNQVSVLLGQGSGSNWTMTPGPRINTDAGPVAVAVGNILGDGHPDLAVANQQADNVQVFPGVGGGFFNDQPQAVKTYAVGQAPSGLFLGDFNGRGTGIAALNAGSNTITLIGPTGAEQTVAAGGVEPTTGFAGNFTGNGFTDLVVGDTADGHLALLLGGATGLSLSQTITNPAVPEPTGLSFSGVSDGVLSFYATTAGRDAATALAFNLNSRETEPGITPGSVPASESELGSIAGPGPAYGPVASAGAALASATAGAFQQVAQLLSANGSTLSLVAPLFTVSILPGEFESGAANGGGVTLLANFLPGTGSGGSGQGLRSDDSGAQGEAADDPRPADEEAAEAVVVLPALPPWEQAAMGLRRAWEQARSEVLERAGLGAGAGAGPAAAPGRAPSPAPASVRPADRSHSGAPAGAPPPGGPRASAVRRPDTAASVDAAIAELAAEGGREVGPLPEGPAPRVERIAAGHGRLTAPIAAAAAMASAAAVARAIHAARNGRGKALRSSRYPASAN